MYCYICLILTFCVSVNGLMKTHVDLGEFKGYVHVGESLTPTSFMRKDKYASLDLENLANGLVMQTVGLDPIIRDAIAPFPLDHNNMISGPVNLTKFVVTGLKYMQFENTSLYRNFNHTDDSLRIDFIGTTPILATKFTIASSLKVLWKEYEVAGRAYISLEHVRLQMEALVRTVPQQDHSGEKVYQLTGLNLDIHVENIRVTLNSSDVPVTPREILENFKDVILKPVTQAAIEEINLVLNQ